MAPLIPPVFARETWQATPENLHATELLDWRQFGGRDADDDLRKGRIVVRSTPPAGIAPILVKRRWWGSIVVQWPSELGSLRGDLSERDIVFALTRFARPLAMGFPAAEERALAHRHMDFYIDGLCAPLRREAVKQEH